jgi:hypothetical protein
MTSLETIKNTIESFTKYHQIGVLSILKKCDNIVINENNNGTFINLTELNQEAIHILEKYITYVLEQKNHLEVVEKERLRIEKTYFNKDNKDNKDV